MKIDDLDRKILNYLQQDARIAASHIAILSSYDINKNSYQIN